MIKVIEYGMPLFVLAAAWWLVWALYMRPQLHRIQAIMGIPALLALPGLSRGQKLLAWLEGRKTIIASVAISFLAVAKSVLDTIAQNSDAFDNLSGIDWGAWFPADTALKITGFLALAPAVLHVIGKLAAALASPQQ
jgi:hypothetical protein